MFHCEYFLTCMMKRFGWIRLSHLQFTWIGSFKRKLWKECRSILLFHYFLLFKSFLSGTCIVTWNINAEKYKCFLKKPWQILLYNFCKQLWFHDKFVFLCFLFKYFIMIVHISFGFHACYLVCFSKKKRRGIWITRTSALSLMMVLSFFVCRNSKILADLIVSNCKWWSCCSFVSWLIRVVTELFPSLGWQIFVQFVLDLISNSNDKDWYV